MWSVEIGNKAGSAWTDLTALVSRETIRFGGKAYQGETGSGFGFDYADHAATQSFGPYRVVRYKIGAVVVGRGRILLNDRGRGDRFEADALRHDVETGDGNLHLRGIDVNRWVRPAETDVARVTALLVAYLAGSPRASTNLADTYVDAGNTVALAAKTYDMTDPVGVLTDIVRTSAKLFFVTVDDELFYDLFTSTAYASGLTVTDDAPNGTDEFAPAGEVSGAADNTEWVSGLRMGYGAGGATVVVDDGAAEAAGDYWVEALFAEGDTSAEASSEGTALLAERKVVEERFRFDLELTDEHADLIKHGQTISFRSGAAGVTTPRTVRVSSLTWEEVGDERWIAHVEASFPDKVGPRHLRRNAVVTRDTLPTDSGRLVYAPACVPSLFDDGARTVGVALESQGWGSTPQGHEWLQVLDDPGIPWTNPPSVFADTAWVDAGRLYLRTLSENGVGLEPGPFVGDWNLYMKFRFTITGDPETGTIKQFYAQLYRIADDATEAGSLYLYFYARNDGDPTVVPGIEVRYEDVLGSGSSDRFTMAWTVGAEYLIRWRHAPSEGLSQAKVWIAGAAEPTDWTVSRDMTGDTNVHITPPELFALVLDQGGTGGDTIRPQLEIDYIRVLQCDPDQPADGQTVGGLQLIAYADGVTDEWSVPTAYVPGSLETMVGGTWQSATEVDPTTGEFGYSWIPEQGQAIRARWRVPA